MTLGENLSIPGAVNFGAIEARITMQDAALDTHPLPVGAIPEFSVRNEPWSYARVKHPLLIDLEEEQLNQFFQIQVPCGILIDPDGNPNPSRPLSKEKNPRTNFVPFANGAQEVTTGYLRALMMKLAAEKYGIVRKDKKKLIVSGWDEKDGVVFHWGQPMKLLMESWGFTNWDEAGESRNSNEEGQQVLSYMVDNGIDSAFYTMDGINAGRWDLNLTLKGFELDKPPDWFLNRRRLTLSLIADNPALLPFREKQFVEELEAYIRTITFISELQREEQLKLLELTCVVADHPHEFFDASPYDMQLMALHLKKNTPKWRHNLVSERQLRQLKEQRLKSLLVDQVYALNVHTDAYYEGLLHNKRSIQRTVMMNVPSLIRIGAYYAQTYKKYQLIDLVIKTGKPPDLSFI